MSAIVVGVLGVLLAIYELNTDNPAKFTAAALLLLFSSWHFIGFLALLFRYAEMTIDARGLSWSVYGHIWRSLPWSAISTIHIDQSTDLTALTAPINSSSSWFLPADMRVSKDKSKPKYICTRYTINTALPHFRLNPIRFTDKLMDFERALSLVNLYVLRHNIRVVDSNSK